MIFPIYVIDDQSLLEVRDSLASSLKIRFKERDSSWYGSFYYLAVLDEAHTLQLCLNRDFEGEPLVDGVDTDAVILKVQVPEETDELLRDLGAQPSLRRLR